MHKMVLIILCLFFTNNGVRAQEVRYYSGGKRPYFGLLGVYNHVLYWDKPEGMQDTIGVVIDKCHEGDRKPELVSVDVAVRYYGVEKQSAKSHCHHCHWGAMGSQEKIEFFEVMFINSRQDTFLLTRNKWYDQCRAFYVQRRSLFSKIKLEAELQESGAPCTYCGIRVDSLSQACAGFNATPGDTWGTALRKGTFFLPIPQIAYSGPGKYMCISRLKLTNGQLYTSTAKFKIKRR